MKAHGVLLLACALTGCALARVGAEPTPTPVGPEGTVGAPLAEDAPALTWLAPGVTETRVSVGATGSWNGEWRRDGSVLALGDRYLVAWVADDPDPYRDVRCLGTRAQFVDGEARPLAPAFPIDDRCEFVHLARSGDTVLVVTQDRFYCGICDAGPGAYPLALRRMRLDGTWIDDEAIETYERWERPRVVATDAGFLFRGGTRDVLRLLDGPLAVERVVVDARELPRRAGHSLLDVAAVPGGALAAWTSQDEAPATFDDVVPYVLYAVALGPDGAPTGNPSRIREVGVGSQEVRLVPAPDGAWVVWREADELQALRLDAVGRAIGEVEPLPGGCRPERGFALEAGPTLVVDCGGTHQAITRGADDVWVVQGDDVAAGWESSLSEESEGEAFVLGGEVLGDLRLHRLPDGEPFHHGGALETSPRVVSEEGGFRVAWLEAREREQELRVLTRSFDSAGEVREEVLQLDVAYYDAPLAAAGGPGRSLIAYRTERGFRTAVFADLGVPTVTEDARVVGGRVAAWLDGGWLLGGSYRWAMLQASTGSFLSEVSIPGGEQVALDASGDRALIATRWDDPWPGPGVRGRVGVLRDGVFEETGEELLADIATNGSTSAAVTPSGALLWGNADGRFGSSTGVGTTEDGCRIDPRIAWTGDAFVVARVMASEDGCALRMSWHDPGEARPRATAVVARQVLGREIALTGAQGEVAVVYARMTDDGAPQLFLAIAR